ncbi:MULTISPECIES: hypothetical protein [Burkholderia]|jgi:predicted porin|nr:hypothetical protein [Burkholderia contaminans]MBK1935197.1 hypothetical protein [Burkholderia contaminans]MCA7911917.1 hypothetical protein [Burkholderia contaminans]MCA8371124.1 hypothetical protein [Burkholderia contaminans]MCQ4563546.1 hypothetical protein [Burkholderia contaminans]MEB4649599.1 hypothetical protein [Burkholderia contaminans]
MYALPDSSATGQPVSGASYEFGATKAAAGVSDSLKGKDGHPGSMLVVDFNVSRMLRPDLALAGGYGHTNYPAGNFATDNVKVSFDNLLSKRTDVFIALVFEHVLSSGYAPMFMLGAASGGNQLSVNVGILHNF